MKDLLAREDVILTEADQCAYGLMTPDRKGRPCPAKKPTKLATNSTWISQELKRKCDRQHTHQPLVAGRAQQAAVYPPGLCKAICLGLQQEVLCQSFGVSGVVQIKPLCSVKIARQKDVDHEEQSLQLKEEIRQAWDDVSGNELIPEWC